MTAPSFQVTEWNRVLDEWSIALQCPLCRTTMDSALCPSCAFEMANHNGILYALPPERVVYYERFIADYEYIRASEGRGSNGARYPHIGDEGKLVLRDGSAAKHRDRKAQHDEPQGQPGKV